MKIFPIFDSILLPLAPTIAGTIADYLQLMTKTVDGHRSQNCDNVVPELSSNLAWWQFDRSIRLVPTSQYQYVSTIAHRLAAKSSLTPLQICENLQSPLVSAIVEPDYCMQLCCWYNDSGYIYFQIAPRSIGLWLNHIHGLPLIELAKHRSLSSATMAVYAHARCCSVLRLADTEKLVRVAANWQISIDRQSDIDECSYLDRCTAEFTSIFEHSAEHRSIHVLMEVLDTISSHHLQVVCSRQLGWSEARAIEPLGIGSNLAGKIRDPNWHKLTLDLAQSWLDFYRHCRIFGDVQRQNPRLAIARCLLTAIVRRYLQVLLENYLGVTALVEL
ncbi:hypothetical protein [Chamaesiphon sp.]|uniref:hypothetical protein n=1 Tax=Chamaesiphon sp. TaxID=2814140 RepID=UPI003592F5AB